ncbi:very short patch repair endonuclease [Puniceibacterium sediminis]|uniref:Very short patch repair endonuclease n=1 Tax=Puniceibacterium sediminis TaxID=1608407 RepID=A0A238VL85_9RHOB|nr:DNA mismatch endonuclease Vsr [Puniceibacterium sediminis]SNR34951.1 T/G mismatch-specific endonuclease [Puniceibacterium sediminis]
MTDIVNKETRSRMMSGIRGKDTRPELLLRRALHARGFRYRLHVKTVSGRPDLVLPKHRVVIFVHGCFWHQHEGCRYASTPKTRAEFWADKFAANVRRDQAAVATLSKEGWRIAIVWECALRKPANVQTAVEKLTEWMIDRGPFFEIGENDLES